MSSEVQEREVLAKKIKHSLENWRELVLPVYDVLLWKDFPLYPGIIVGVTTFAFTSIVLLDPTLLSFVASTCLCLVILDYAAPMIISKIFNPDSWNGPKEKKLDEICGEIAYVYTGTKAHIGYLYSLKETKPKVYYLTTILGLLILSCIGNNVNNIFITYLCFTALLLLPGLKHNGYLEKFLAHIKQRVAQATQKEKKQ